jgi:hypothetical protein
MDNRKEILLNTIRKHGKMTRADIIKKANVGPHFVRQTLVELRKRGVLTVSISDNEYLWHFVRDQAPVKIDVALPRTHQAGTTGRMTGYGWTTPKRPGAMDAFSIPSRGF